MLHQAQNSAFLTCGQRQKRQIFCHKCAILAKKEYICGMRLENSRVVEDESMSAMVSLLRFPLTALVVLSHAYIGGLSLVGALTPYVLTSYIIAKIVGNMAVPCFLFVSGYLFFRNIDNFSLRTYGDKLWRRARTLLLPYIVWNALILLLFFIGQSVVPQLFSGRNMAVADYSWVEWLKAFWVVDGTQSPINAPLWYIRDLLVLVVLSPIIYHALKQRWVGVAFLTLMLGLGLSGDVVNGAIVWLQPKYIFLFSLGAWLALHRVQIPRFRWLPFVFAVMICGGLTAGFFLCKDIWLRRFMYELTILVGTLSILYVSHFLAGVKGWRVPSFLGRSSFFIYLFHYIPLALLSKVLLKVVAPTTNVEYFAIFFGSAIAILALCVAAFHVMHRLLPKTTSLLLGGRV